MQEEVIDHYFDCSRAWHNHWIGYFVAIFFLLCTVAPITTAEISRPDANVPLLEKHVLIFVSSGMSSLPSVDKGALRLIEELKDRGIDSQKIHVEYLDLTRHKGSQYRQQLASLLMNKYSNQKIDLVFSIMALDFLLKEGKELAGGVPILNYNAPIPEGVDISQQQILLQSSKEDCSGTLQLALTLFPHSERVFVIMGNGVLDLERRDVISRDLAPWREKLQFEDSQTLGIEEIEAKVSSLQKNTIVLGLPMSSDARGKALIPGEVIGRVAKSSNAPVFALYNSHLGSGALGGNVINFEMDAVALAEKAIEILRGSLRLNEGVTVLEESNIPVFDWQQLERWGAKASALPANTIFINRPPTLWGQYRLEVLAATVAFLGLGALSFLLVIMNHRQKLTNAELQESRKQYRNLIEDTPDLVTRVDTAGCFLFVNHTAQAIYGLEPEECIGRLAFDFIHPEDRGITEAAFRKWLESSGEAFEHENRQVGIDGREHYMAWSIRAEHDESGAVRGFACTARNITERNLSATALQTKTALLEAQTNATIDGILVVDENQKRVLSNQRIIELFAVPYTILNDDDDTALLKHVVSLTKNPDQFLEKVFYLYDHIDEISRDEIEFKNGMILDRYSAPVLGKDGKNYGRIWTFRDITEQKQAEAEKLAAQKIADEHGKQALIGQIAGKMAHDFNNILGIIMGNTELAIIDCPHTETRKTLELVFEQTIRGKNLTKNLIAFAKDQEPKQEFFRISEKVDLVLNLMRKDLEGIELRKEEGPGVPELLADPGMIEHALVNLIQNSIHALSMVEYPRITVRTYSHDNHICFEILDNGCGISQDNLEHIYEPSFTLKGSRDVTGSYKTGIKGTGYGMSNVKKYIEQHKGSISVESEPGSGTKFTISLPIIEKELTTEEKTEIRKGKIYFGKYILLVEDEPAIADVQYRILTQEPCNHKVDIANNGKVAMDLIGRNKYDLVSLDYVLPGDINGMDIYHHIRSSDKTIPILFISGNIEFLESIKALKQKDTIIDHLSKPCQNKDYVNSINGLFESARVQR